MVAPSNCGGPTKTPLTPNAKTPQIQTTSSTRIYGLFIFVSKRHLSIN